uniref:Uncharacterized protein n=1 Tax=viral metagenome TaxID=1070528 RepID=A0A6H1Z9P5_9ZZZZ
MNHEYITPSLPAKLAPAPTWRCTFYPGRWRDTICAECHQHWGRHLLARVRRAGRWVSARV